MCCCRCPYTSAADIYLSVFKLWSLSWTNCAMTPFSKEKKRPHLCFFLSHYVLQENISRLVYYLDFINMWSLIWRAIMFYAERQ